MTEVDVPSWLKSLALAPEYHPTEAEFSDPIDYIFRIEQEAAQFGICKIVPPHLKASKRVVFNNLNLSLANSQDATATGEAPVVGRNMCPARSMGGCAPGSVGGLDLEATAGAGSGSKAKFTTRRQQLGWNSRKVRAGLVPQAVVHKLVWQSGETYTIDQFEAKAKIFARNRLGTSQEIGPLAVEALFWKATLEKAISIEYANDIPGSAFAEPREGAGLHPRRRAGLDENGEFFAENGPAPEEEEMDMSGDEGDASKCAGVGADNGRSIGCKLSNSAWNMRRVARSPGSLLRFIPDEVPGVTSPMVYIGMLFSWFAWHVEDHELHSLNYLHTGAPKTWYAVPGDAAPALEEVVRVQGYGGQLNSQDAFARLGEKTTVMSPEVLVAAGVPCCRLVQNAGEYVVTFPRAYHLGFSHGFNCGEAANFATPGWLEVAREASVRRAAMKYLPMLSHQQLLYTLAGSLISRSRVYIACEKRSSRLKGKKRVGEEVVKSMFVNDAIQQNDMIGKLLDNKVASCLLVRDLKRYAPHADTNISEGDMTLKPCKPEEEKQEEVVPEGDALESPASERPNDIQVLPSSTVVSVASEVPVEEHQENTEPHELNDISGTMEKGQVCEGDPVTSALPRDLSTLPCAACGILCYTGMAIVQPSQIVATRFRPLHSYASGPGGYRSKGVINPLSGVLPGKADKKSADFHMLPNVEVQPLLELEGTTPDIFTDALYEDQTEEPEVWTPDLKECPTMYKDCSNDVTQDAEIPRSGQTSAVSERDEYLSPEVAKAVSSVGNDGVTPNNSVGDAMEVEKQNHEIVSGLGSAVSGHPMAQVSNAGATHCCSKRIESKPVAEGTLSSLQLLAAAYEDNSDVDEYDEIEHGDAGNFVGGPLTGLSPNSEIISSLPISKDSKPSAELSEIMLSPSGSQTLALKGTASSLVELSEEHLKSGAEMDNCKRTCDTPEETARSLIGSSSWQPNDKNKDGEIAARDEAKQKSALSFGECVTCSLPHDSFFDSFEEAALKSVENGTVELENSSEKNDIVVSGDENSKTCALVAPESDLESNEPVGVPCTSILEAGSLLAEGSSVTTDSCSIKLGEALDNCASLAATGTIQLPNVNGVGEACGVAEPIQIESSVPNQLQNLKGAARPRMLCLEHAVAAQKRLEPIGGGTVIIICHSSFPKVEEQAKAVAPEVGANHQWRSVPFKQAGDDAYTLITAAVEAEEEFLPGDSDWVDQLGLSIHGQSKSLSNDVDIANGNPSSEESEEPGNRRIWKGRKEKKSSIIRQWCGRGWRADQLHSFLGGCRSTSVQIDSTTAPAILCTSVGVSSFIENGRSRKIMRPARLAEYTADGRVPKGESHTKKSCNKRKILLEMSEDEFDEQNSEATPSRRGGSREGFFNLHGSSGDSLWREVPIASTDSLLLPLHLSDMAEETGRDDFLSFAPEALFRSENEMRLSANEANTSANISMHNGANQSCAVVGGFVQRGAKLVAQQKLQKLCRQLSTPVSVPCTPLTIPTRFASWVKPSHKRISAAKLVNRLKRKPATELPRYSKKQRFAEVAEQKKNRSLSLSKRESGLGGHQRRGEGIVENVLMSENIISVSDEEAKEDLLQDHDTPSSGEREVNTDISNNHSETTAGEEDEKRKPELCDSELQLVRDCNSRFLGNTDSSPSKSISQQYHYGIEDPPKENHSPCDRTPNIDPSSMSILMYCTESLPQGLNEPVSNSAGEASILRTEPVLVPRRGRVRGKRTKSRQWKSCIQMPSLEAEEASVSPTCDENRTSGDGSNDPGLLEPKLSPKSRDSGAQADPDFFPYLSSCLTSSTTSVRRRRICTPGMDEWGADKDGKGEPEGSADHPSVQHHQDTKMKKRKNGQKPSNKRSEDLEGEFQCDMEGCIMAFDSIRDLQLHKKNLCTWKGCGKHFHMHKYLLQHRRVHLDDRPLKCPWKGCTQAFKWAWARTEHIRVHTGERPYKCMVSGCGQTFRFVSDFSRHKRNTGHRPT